MAVRAASSYGGEADLVSAHGYMPGVPQSFVLTSAQPLPEPVTYADVVTAGGMITFMTQPLDEQFAGPYSVVRWRDYWDQQWEENRGSVKKVAENDDWLP